MNALDEQLVGRDAWDRIARINWLLDERTRRMGTSRTASVSSLVGLVILICAGAGLFAAGAIFETLIR